MSVRWAALRRNWRQPKWKDVESSSLNALNPLRDFSIGIGKALDAPAPENQVDVDLVSVSTTLATNAIVENRGQKVGLLIFPPRGKPTRLSVRGIGFVSRHFSRRLRSLGFHNSVEVR